VPQMAISVFLNWDSQIQSFFRIKISSVLVSNTCDTSLFTSACVQNFQRSHFSFCFAFCEICVLSMNTCVGEIYLST